MKLDAYIRVSRVGGREGESFMSPDVQRERIESYVASQGYSIGERFVELDASGGTTDRPMLQEALSRIERGESAGIAVAKVDRFARSLTDALIAIKRIDDAGGSFVCLDPQFDTNTPTGTLMLNIFLSFAQFELERIRESWGEAQRRAVARGVHVASRTPTGYIRREDSRLEPDPDAAPVIADVFRRRAAGGSWRELAAMLTDAGVVTPYGNLNWTSSSVAKVIANPVYLGEARSGEHRNADAHPPLVTRGEWQAAQAARAPSVLSGNGGANGDGSLLAGILRCAGCRYAMKADKMTLPDGSRVRIYRCRGEHAAGKCQARASVMGRVIEPFIITAFFDVLAPDGVRAQASAPSEDVDALKAELEDAQAELDAYLAAVSAASVGRDAFARGAETRSERLSEARAVLDDALAASAGFQLPPIAQLRTEWETMSTADRRRHLAAVLDAVVLRRGRGRPIEDRAVILWRGEAPDDFPSRGKRVPLEPYHWPN